MKLIPIILLTSSILHGYTLNSTYIDSSVFYSDDVYKYEYSVDSKINKRDISNITIDLCNPCEIYDVFANGSYDVEFNNGSIKFDDIDVKGINTFTFGYYSNYAPLEQDARIKAANRTYGDRVLSPSCQVPEPSYMSLIFGFIVLAKRRR